MAQVSPGRYVARQSPRYPINVVARPASKIPVHALIAGGTNRSVVPFPGGAAAASHRTSRG